MTPSCESSFRCHIQLRNVPHHQTEAEHILTKSTILNPGSIKCRVPGEPYSGCVNDGASVWRIYGCTLGADKPHYVQYRGLVQGALFF